MVPAAIGIAGTALAAAGWFGYTAARGDGALNLGSAAGSHGDGGLSLGSADGSRGAAAAQPEPAAAAPAAVSIPDGATGVAPDSTLTVTAPSGEQVGAVELTYQTEAVPGVFSADRRTWTASGQLRAGVSYALSAVTMNDSGGTGIQRESFTTSRPDSPLKLDLVAPADGSTVGIGQPVVVAFTRPVADTERAAIEQALSVSADPPQTGHWSWLSPSRIDYRPRDYWQPGTKVTVHLALDGLSDGHGHYGTADRDFGFTVGRDQQTTIDLKADQATVRRDGQVVHTFAVTGGMPGLDTWSGTYAVIDKSADVHMDSRTAGLGAEYDIPDVKWDVHLTYTGTYVHSAPWSVGSQGVRNVSHGCVGASPTNAQWFFSNTLPGDIVKVINTPRQVAPGNGFADWQESWDQWLAGSAVQ